MNERFPLSPKMWQEWTKDEISLSEGLEAFTEIEKLYERGVQEYLSVPLWYDYINFLQESDQSVSQCSPSGISKMRNLFERALTAAGLHIVKGSKIWEAYREFEQAILLTIDDNNNEEKAKQVQRIRALFHRQLSVPLVDLRSTLMDCKSWEGEQGNVNDINSDFDGIPSNVITSHQKAIEMYNARKQYEDQLSNPDTSDTDRLQQFKNYLKFEESSGDPARVQILYERAVAEFPISSDLWLGYTSYLDRTLKVPDLLKSVYSRATRNCTWVGELWVRYLLSLERIHASEEELSAVFEQSLQCRFPSFKEYLDLFLTRVDGLRRRMSIAGAKEDELDYALIRDTFQRAVEYLSPQLVSCDDLLHLHAYWARLEANLGKDMLAARGVWENLLKKSGSLLEVWLSYIEMETAMGHINEARSIYKRCYSKRFPGTGSEDICHSWLRFEREYGTLDDLDLAVKKVTPRLQELMIFKTQQEPKKELMLSSKRESSVSTNTQKKRKISKMSSDKQPPAKRKKENAPKPAEASDVDQIRATGNANDTGAVDKGEVATLPKAAETTATNKEAVGNSKIMDSKPKFYNDQCTAFISNLSLEASEKHLQEFFSDCGGVTAVRLLRDKFTGKSRGLAYVDFSDDEHLATAIAKNKQKLLGRKLSIARSDPKQSHKRSSTGSSSKGHGQGVRFRNDRNRSVEVSEGTFEERRGNNVKLMGKNTFAAPRAVAKSHGRSIKEAKMDGETEKLKSNDEFRDMLLKK
uniref:Squamous cell carcinoma antigen recognized by T-cells 3 n=1 Tax=Elaeis guineensis var. tenera TaxID=51953 RepID=A0A6I9RKN4_ELAGV|nr:squamous cell carcinoma antigen recognized by T-cells 3 [Elaeis guineensis]